MSHSLRNITQTVFINSNKAPIPKTGRLSFSPNPKLIVLFENIEITVQALLLIIVSFFVLYLVHVLILLRTPSTTINRDPDADYNSYQSEQSV